MKWILALLTLALVVLHQDFWNWDKTALVGGFLPVGLWYHALYCVAAAVLLTLFVLTAWPRHLENAEPETPEAKRAEGQSGH